MSDIGLRSLLAGLPGSDTLGGGRAAAHVGTGPRQMPSLRKSQLAIFEGATLSHA